MQIGVILWLNYQDSNIEAKEVKIKNLYDWQKKLICCKVNVNLQLNS